MPRNLIPPEPWWPQAADLMVRYDLSLREAAAELGTDLSIDQADAILKRKLFQKTLEEARTAYYIELGSNPNLTKEAVVGQLYRLVMRLAEDREDYKAADALLKLSKIKGWIGEGDQPSVLSSLSQVDIDRIRERLKEMQKPKEPNNSLTSELLH